MGGLVGCLLFQGTQGITYGYSCFFLTFYSELQVVAKYREVPSPPFLRGTILHYPSSVSECGRCTAVNPLSFFRFFQFLSYVSVRVCVWFRAITWPVDDVSKLQDGIKIKLDRLSRARVSGRHTRATLTRIPGETDRKL